MAVIEMLDREGIAQICRAHDVSRLQMFGSAATGRFDPAHSDIDLLVDLSPDVSDPFDSYFGLKEDLERLLDCEIDLVMTSAVRNPHFAASAFGTAEELYAA